MKKYRIHDIELDIDNLLTCGDYTEEEAEDLEDEIIEAYENTLFETELTNELEVTQAIQDELDETYGYNEGKCIMFYIEEVK